VALAVVLQAVVAQEEQELSAKVLQVQLYLGSRIVVVAVVVLEVHHQTEMAVLVLKALLLDRHSGLAVVVALAQF
jgi:hypothetical protein